MYIKWIGGKTLLSSDLIQLFPKKIDKYIEPFSGSGSMYFAYNSSISLDNNCYGKKIPQSLLYDLNPHLINCHKIVRDRVEELINNLDILEKNHNLYKVEDLALDFYLRIREKVTSKITEQNSIELASYFIYINKTCFNGIWRVNKSGKNNVPFNKNLYIKFDYQKIKKASIMLHEVHLENKKFEELNINKTNEEIFVYLDPPYYPLSLTSSFTSYNYEKINNNNLLSSLKSFCIDLDEKNIKWMMSNSMSDKVKNEFSKWNIKKIYAHRFVKALGSKEEDKKETRKKIEEVVITNY